MPHMGRQQREPSPVGIVMPDLTSAKKALRRLLVHPLAKGRELDDPGTTILRKRILQEKKFLRSIYEEWYAAIANRVPRGNQPVLELGSGAGFLPLTIPDLITSDILKLPDISLVLDAHFLPFKASSLRAIVMIDVIHHLGDVRRFLHEATRCVKPGGVMFMIEPW